MGRGGAHHTAAPGRAGTWDKGSPDLGGLRDSLSLWISVPVPDRSPQWPLAFNQSPITQAACAGTSPDNREEVSDGP